MRTGRLQLLTEVLALYIKVQESGVVNENGEGTGAEGGSCLTKNLVQHNTMTFYKYKYKYVSDYLYKVTAHGIAPNKPANFRNLAISRSSF